MIFEEALKAMREGKKVKRVSVPEIYLKDGDLIFEINGECYSYNACTYDILSRDWEIVDE